MLRLLEDVLVVGVVVVIACLILVLVGVIGGLVLVPALREGGVVLGIVVLVLCVVVPEDIVLALVLVKQIHGALVVGENVISLH